MLSRFADRVLRYLNEFKNIESRLPQGYNPVIEVFTLKDQPGHWFGKHRINISHENNYILADITDLDIHTFALTIQQALIRSLEHAATLYEDLQEEGIFSEADSKHLELLDTAFKEMLLRIDYEETPSRSTYNDPSTITNICINPQYLVNIRVAIA